MKQKLLWLYTINKINSLYQFMLELDNLSDNWGVCQEEAVCVFGHATLSHQCHTLHNCFCINLNLHDG